jgi:hypothetical protein
MLRSIAASPNCLSATRRQGCYDAHQHLDCPRYHTRPVSHHAILATGERDAADLCREPGCLGVPTVRRPIIGGDQRVVRPQESLCKPCRSRDKAYQRAPCVSHQNWLAKRRLWVKGAGSTSFYDLSRESVEIMPVLPDTGRLSGCVQELSCLSTTHKEK